MRRKTHQTRKGITQMARTYTKKDPNNMSAKTALVEKANALDDGQFLQQYGDPDFTDVNFDLFKVENLSKKIKQDILNAENPPSRQEIKTLVDLYYQMQDFRKAIREQIRSIENDESKTTSAVVLDYFLKSTAVIEHNCQKVLELICLNSEVGRWLLQIKGIGPVLAAGCLAYFDVEGKDYATQFISYAGLNDNNRPWIGKTGAEAIMKEISSDTWLDDDQAGIFSVRTQWRLDYLREHAYKEGKGWNRIDLIKAAAKIPYNKNLKVLMWKIGKSFIWVQNRGSLYGNLFAERKALETEKNNNGDYADQAAHILATKKFSNETIAKEKYMEGKLPDAHIVARAMRRAEKIFVVHLFEEMYRVYHKNDPNGNTPPRYYILEHSNGEHNVEISPEVPYSC